jgi:hypothetical protein
MKSRTFAAIDYSYWYFFFIIFGFLLLLAAYGHNYIGINFWDKLYKVIDPVASIMTFITTLVIFYIQAKQKWENSIEKRLSVRYIYVGAEGNDNTVVAEVVDAYLPGESDVRAWAQSLGQQMMGFLDFDMHWDESKPEIKYHDRLKSFIKAYSISVYITTNPTDNDTIKKFKLKRFKHSEICISSDGSCVKWLEKF